MKVCAKVVFSLILLATFILGGCVSSTRVMFDSTVPDAAVYLDGKHIGQTPVSVRLSNAYWKNPHVVLKKEGYGDRHADLRRDMKGANIAFGLIWLPAFLWIEGPSKVQFIPMYPVEQ